MTSTLHVGLGSHSYDIVIGAGLLAHAGEHIAPFCPLKKAIIVTDETVAKLHLTRLKQSLEVVGIKHEVVVLPAGESTKSFSRFEHLCSDILKSGIERKSLLIALGGGVIGDITGFAASVLLRAIQFIQIPTTLLAMVDSSVGGKTGINTSHGKNLVGSFHQPKLVLADIDTLKTLPPREFLAGYAEVVKYGCIGDAEFFTWLDDNSTRLKNQEAEAISYAVEQSCRHKAAIVAADEKETGMRALLNLGHTFGHALEAEAGYNGTLLHGEAVAMGMAMAYYLSVRLNLCTEKEYKRLTRHLSDVGLHLHPRAIGLHTSAARLVEHMRKDKKVSDGNMVFILPRSIGECFIANDIPAAIVEKALTDYLS